MLSYKLKLYRFATLYLHNYNMFGSLFTHSTVAVFSALVTTTYLSYCAMNFSYCVYKLLIKFIDIMGLSGCDIITIRKLNDAFTDKIKKYENTLKQAEGYHRLELLLKYLHETIAEHNANLVDAVMVSTVVPTVADTVDSVVVETVDTVDAVGVENVQQNIDDNSVEIN